MRGVVDATRYAQFFIVKTTRGKKKKENFESSVVQCPGYVKPKV